MLRLRLWVCGCSLCLVSKLTAQACLHTLSPVGTTTWEKKNQENSGFTVHWSWFAGHGSGFTVHGLGCMAQGSRFMLFSRFFFHWCQGTECCSGWWGWLTKTRFQSGGLVNCCNLVKDWHQWKGFSGFCFEVLSMVYALISWVEIKPNSTLVARFRNVSTLSFNTLETAWGLILRKIRLLEWNCPFCESKKTA